MADIPSPRIAKRFSLGSANPTTDGAALSVAYVNLAKQALPVQGGQIGFFGGALLVVTTGAFTGGGSVQIKLQGCVDDPATAANWFDLGMARFDTLNDPPGAGNEYTTNTTVLAISPNTSASAKSSLMVPGPLPQFVRAVSVKTGTINSLASGVSAELVAIG